MMLVIDASTTALKAQLLSPRSLEVLKAVAVDYDALPAAARDCPPPAPLPSHSEPGRVLFPSKLFFAALDHALISLGKDSLAQVTEVTGCAQQHTSVAFTSALDFSACNATGDALHQCIPVFAWSPTWQDSSTQVECSDIDEHLQRSEQEALRTSGSMVCRRFTGPQIAKLSKDTSLDALERITLLSQALTSVFAGELVPAEVADASGMNLMDLKSHAWSTALLEATCQACAKGTSLASLSRVLGPHPQCACWYGICPYFSKRFGFPPSCRVLSFTGDNPSSFAAAASRVVCSFGTSDTLCGSLSANSLLSLPQSHTMVDTLHPNRLCVRMLCWSNGNASREVVMKRTGGSWEEFDRRLIQAMEPFMIEKARRTLCMELVAPELIPPTILAPICLYSSLDATQVLTSKDEQLPVCLDAFSVVWTRVLAMKMHAIQAGIKFGDCIVVTGGGSNSKGLVQIVADVFQCPVFITNQGACHGGGVRLQRALGIGLTSLQSDSKPDALPGVALDHRVEAQLFERISEMEEIARSIACS